MLNCKQILAMILKSKTVGNFVAYVEKKMFILCKTNKIRQKLYFDTKNVFLVIKNYIKYKSSFVFVLKILII